MGDNPYHKVIIGGGFAWLLWLLLIKFENRIIVLIRWAFQYFSYSRSARQLTIDEPLHLPITHKRK